MYPAQLIYISGICGQSYRRQYSFFCWLFVSRRLTFLVWFTRDSLQELNYKLQLLTWPDFLSVSEDLYCTKPAVHEDIETDLVENSNWRILFHVVDWRTSSNFWSSSFPAMLSQIHTFTVFNCPSILLIGYTFERDVICQQDQVLWRGKPICFDSFPYQSAQAMMLQLFLIVMHCSRRNLPLVRICSNCRKVRL